MKEGTAQEFDPSSYVYHGSGAQAEFSLLKERLATYLKPEDVAQVEAAYRFSDAAHKGQLRASGDPYISHPVEVCTILSEWHLDAQIRA